MKNSIFKIFAFAVTLLAVTNANAQVKIGDNPTTITASTVLDVESTNKGVIFPRVTLTGPSDVTTVASPATATLVYHVGNAAMEKGYYYWDGATSKWQKFVSETGGAGGAGGGNITVYKGGYIGLFLDQETNGVTMGEFKFRLKRNSTGSTTTSNQTNQSELMFIGTDATIQPVAYASTQWRNSNYDMYDDLQFGPSSTATRGAAYTPLLKNTWYAWGNAGLVTVGGSVEKRQYVLTTDRTSDHTLYRIEWSISDPTPTSPTGNPYADAKVFIYIEMIVGQ